MHQQVAGGRHFRLVASKAIRTHGMRRLQHELQPLKVYTPV
jgi:hypothetical protein